MIETPDDIYVRDKRKFPLKDESITKSNNLILHYFFLGLKLSTVV